MKFRDIITEGLYDPAIFKAVFIVGGPGSGKSYIQRSSLTGHGFKVINSDHEFEYLMRKNNLSLKMPDSESSQRELVRDRAKQLTHAKHNIYLTNRLGLILDGTGKDYDKIKSQKTRLEQIGYDCYMIFVNTSLEIALERNKKRSRTVPEDIVISAWKQVQNNLGKYQSSFGKDKFSIIDNNSLLSDQVLTKLWKAILNFSKSKITNPVAINWINSQLKNKNRL